MKNIRTPQFTELFTLYHSYRPEIIPLELQKVKQYVMNGYNWYIKNVSNEQRIHDEYGDILTFLHRIKILSEEMIILSGPYLSLIEKEKNIEVNISPFVNYLEQEDTKSILDAISMAQSNMRLYLNESNILEYKACSKFMDDLEVMFMWIS